MSSLICAQKRIYQVPVPHETLDEFREEVDVNYMRYGSSFKTKEEFELFWMLPLDSTQKGELLKALSEEKYFLDDVVRCPGRPAETAEHRLYCIACCARYSPCCARPYYG